MSTLKLKALGLAIALGVMNSAFAGLVNINEADGEALAYHLSGVGIKKAEAIILYRGEHGAFADIEDLINVKGIGEGILNKNLEDISLSQGAVELVKSGGLAKKKDTKLKKPVVISKDKASKSTDASKSSKKEVVAAVSTKKVAQVRYKVATSKKPEKTDK